MKRFYKYRGMKIPDRDNQKPAKKMNGPQNEGRFSQNYEP